MALSNLERAAVQELKQQGYSNTQIAGFIAGQRLDKPSKIQRELTTPEPQPNVLQRVVSDIPSDIGDAFSGAVDSVSRGIETGREARAQVESGEISPISGTVKTIGGGLRAGAGVIGEAVGGLLKLPFTQKAEETTAEAAGNVAQSVVESAPAQTIAEAYNNLSPDQKAVVDGILGTAEGVATGVGVGAAGNVAKKGIISTGKGVNKSFIQGVKLMEEAAEDLRGVNTTGALGISDSIKLGLAPEDIMQRVARVSKGKQAAFEGRAKESVGSYLVSRNIFGTPDQIVDQLYKRMKDSMKRVDTGLARVKGTYKDQSFLRALRELSEREQTVGGFGTKSPDTPRINDLLKKAQNQGLTLTEANEVKRLYERNVKLDFLRDNVASGVEASNRVDNAMRDFITNTAAKNGFDTVTDLNRETSLAKQLLDDIGAEYAGSAGNNAISLSDTIFLAEATGNPVAAAGFLAKKTLGSKKVMSATARLLSKDAGTKEALPNVHVVQPDPEKLSAYLEFLSRTSATSQ